jgi:hypothetical protein
VASSREQPLADLHAEHADDPVVALQTEGLDAGEEVTHAGEVAHLGPHRVGCGVHRHVNCACCHCCLLVTRRSTITRKCRRYSTADPVPRRRTGPGRRLTHGDAHDRLAQVSVVGLGCNNFGMRIGRKETGRGGRRARRRHQLLRHGRHLRRHQERDVPRARPWAPGGTRSCWPPSSACPTRATRAGPRPPTSAPRSRTASPGSAPTASTSTSCTRPTRRRRSPRRWARWSSWWPRARSASSAAPTSPRPCSTRPRRRHPTAARASSACRTSTTSSTASPRTGAPGATARAPPSCPSSRWPAAS